MSEKDDKVLLQLEAILKELQDSKEQTASTIAVKHKSSISFGSLLSVLLKGWGLKILVILLLVVSMVGTAAYFFYSSANNHSEKGSYVEQMRELSSLATSQAYVKAVIEKEDNQLFGKEINANLPGTKRKLLLIIPGMVTAGIDLEQIENKDIHVIEDEKKIELTLPRAEILQEPSLQFDHVQTFSVEGIFRDEVNWEEAYGLANEAKEQVRKEAVTQGLLQLAEKNAEKILQEFFTQMGYEIEIKYKEVK
ncbi:DUF4230 domain-containing protein [Bacillus sp. 31A1R]|uniref:DUF4230 domain-containing protein n=1 Tax=Robertmurraya mangrovi TaxID=3098077 RepID=A0ABU5IX92_9BACI|nr:DUF4230 domain-containing protein [Bacillus sp. 31A1R]MDZ5471750.1 DUF4230 domain-containing protein [Bacillus sp. 31A1R]